jgi:hypothetical protein
MVSATLATICCDVSVMLLLWLMTLERSVPIFTIARLALMAIKGLFKTYKIPACRYLESAA